MFLKNLFCSKITQLKFYFHKVANWNVGSITVGIFLNSRLCSHICKYPWNIAEIFSIIQEFGKEEMTSMHKTIFPRDQNSKAEWML